MKSFMDKYPHILSLWSESGEALPGTMNQEQKQAIQRALESSYFLIQGPPGKPAGNASVYVSSLMPSLKTCNLFHIHVMIVNGTIEVNFRQQTNMDVECQVRLIVSIFPYFL